jgi:hypothetical protein
MKLNGSDINKAMLNGQQISKAMLNGVDVLSVSKVIALDSFNRANAPTLGNAETGQTWQSLSGTLKIVSNQVVATSVSKDISVIDTGLSDCIVSDTMVSRCGGVVFRAVDVNNCLYVLSNEVNYNLYKVKNGAITSLGIYKQGVETYNNDKILVKLNGTAIQVYMNGTIIFDVTESDFVTATKHGVCVYYQVGAVDDFKVEAI